MGLTLTDVARPPARRAPDASCPGPAAAGGPSSGRAATTAAVVAVGLVAWAVAVDPGGFRPFTTLRWAVLAATVLVAAAVGWRERPPLPRLVRGCGLALLAWLALTTAFAIDPMSAWLGHPQRHLGFLTWVVLVVAFRVGTVLRTDAAHRVLGRGASLALVVLGASAAGDLAGWSIVPSAAATFGGRVGGLLGQPAYLGAAAVAFVPVVLGAAAGERSRPWRTLGIVGAALGIVAVVTSQTRGAWVGLLVAAFVGWPAVRARLGPRRLGALLAGVIAASVLVALLTPIGGRAWSTIDADGGGGRSRLDEWRVAVAVVADHPVVGVGPEGYRVAVTEHLDDDYARAYGREVVVDRAHDGILDVAAIGGLPAAALAVALGVLVAVRAWRVRRATDPFLVGAAAAVLGYAAQQLVLFPVAEIDPVVWLLAGVVVAATSSSGDPASVDSSVDPLSGAPVPGDPASSGDPASAGDLASGDRTSAGEPASTGEPASPRTSGRRRVVPVVAAVGAALVLVAAGLDLSADRHLAAAERARDRGDQLAAIAEADAATRLRPDSLDTWYVAAGVTAGGDSLADLDGALDRIEAGLERSPRDPALADRHEQLLVERALRSQLPADLDRAVEASRDRLAADPANPAHHRALGLVLAARGDRAGAVAALGRALDLAPDDAVARAALERLGGAPS